MTCDVDHIAPCHVSSCWFSFRWPCFTLVYLSIHQTRVWLFLVLLDKNSIMSELFQFQGMILALRVYGPSGPTSYGPLTWWGMKRSLWWDVTPPQLAGRAQSLVLGLGCLLYFFSWVVHPVPRWIQWRLAWNVVLSHVGFHGCYLMSSVTSHWLHTDYKFQFNSTLWLRYLRVLG